MATIDAFANLTCENFDKTQLILKVITESFDHAPWWTRTVLYFMVTWFDTGLATLGSISPGKGTDYGTLRCYRYLVERTSQGSDQLHSFCHRLFSRPYGATLSLNITCILWKFLLVKFVKASIAIEVAKVHSVQLWYSRCRYKVCLLLVCEIILQCDNALCKTGL